GRAGLVLADKPDQLAGRGLHGADEHRQAVLALRNQRAVMAVVDAIGAIIGLADHRREGSARERDVHLVADLLQAGLDDRQCQCVDRSGHAFTRMRRLPIASTVALEPGSITVVASICWTTAGPAIVAPAGR